jgi:hypothetical protein
MGILKSVVDWGTVIFSLLAAMVWLRASLVKMPKEAGLRGAISDIGPALLAVDDAIGAVWRQGRLNAIAAGCAGVAAACLAVSTWIGTLWDH